MHALTMSVVYVCDDVLRPPLSLAKPAFANHRWQIIADDYSHPTLQLTSQLLTLNPEYYTIWNVRRRVLEHVFARELEQRAVGSPIDDADRQAADKAGLTVPQHEIALLIKEDLQFLIPLLKQYPKCYWIWNHRRWLLTTAVKHVPAHLTTEMWRGELALVSKMLSLDSRNFHGWGYRREVIENLETLSGESKIESEFEYTTKMIQSNLSNFSAWHNRGQLIPRLLSERNADDASRRALLDAEFELITKALYTDPYDQSLWFYHQYLMATFNAQNAKSPQILASYSDQDCLYYLRQEIDSIREMLDGAEDCKYIYQALLDYSKRYLDMGSDDKVVVIDEMKDWLAELRKVDPLREGRWNDLATSMKL